MVVVGLDGSWETEGYDRRLLSLPGRQDELVEAVVAANPRTIVVLNAGSPVAMPWLDRVPAVLQTWYPGQEYGRALAALALRRRTEITVAEAAGLTMTWLKDAPSAKTGRPRSWLDCSCVPSARVKAMPGNGGVPVRRSYANAPSARS